MSHSAAMEAQKHEGLAKSVDIRDVLPDGHVIAQVTEQDVRKFQKMMAAVEMEIRRILDHIGLDIGPDTGIDKITTQMMLAGIEIYHIVDGDGSAKEIEGWHIIQRKADNSADLLIILSHPWEEDGRIKMKRTIPNQES